MTSFGSLLRSHRQRAKLSLPTLGRRVSLDFSYLSRLERGQRKPPLRAAILALATALDLTGEETDTLLVAGGQLPQALAQLGPWTPLSASSRPSSPISLSPPPTASGSGK